MDELKDKLIQSYNNGNFFEFVYKVYYQEKNKELLSNLLSEFHNTGKLELIELFKKLKNTSGKHNFFLIRRIFESVLPDINAPVIEVAACVKHLTLEAGQDMAAYTLLAPFKEFCQKEAIRTKELFDFALSDEKEEFDYLSIAIESGVNIDETEYVNQAIKLLDNENEIIKQRVIFALGRIQYQDKSLLNSIVETIERSSSLSPTDVILATTLRALFSITSQSEDLEPFFLNFLTNHSEHLGDRYIHAVSEILFYDDEKISSNIELLLLDICIHVNTENKGTINNIDYALERILKRGDFTICINFLERFFELSEYKLSIKCFDSFVQELHNYRDTYLSSLVTRWFLSRKVMFGKYCYELLKNSNEGISIGFDKSFFIDENKNAHLFLARKACGWFFSQPKTAISLIESLIADISDDDLKDIEELLFKPLCISYSGSICQRLEELSNSSELKLKKVVTNVLSKYKKYQESVKAAFEVNELIPSSQDRHTYWKYHNKLMNKSMKEAQGKSLFRSFFSANESVLLYGNKSIHYIYHGEQKTRQELPLQEFSHSVELASMHNLDPHGLENIIWQFKVEGCTS